MFGVVLLSQFVGATIALVLAVLRSEPVPSSADVGWAIAGGVAGSAGITSLYYGLATGRIAVVAPVTGVLAATIPVVAGWILQGTPSGLQFTGIGLAILAVVLVSMSTDPTGPRASGVRYGLVGGVGFGLFNVFASRFAQGSVFGPLVIVRAFEAISVVLFVMGTRRAWRLPRSVLLLAIAVGVGDMAGNGFFILAAQAGRLDIAGVLSSLYPVTTIVLATLLLHERVTRQHALGIGFAIAAIALIAGG